jgi:ATP-dependent Lhr-like helicase
MFTADLLTATQMLPSQLDDVLGELVTRGWITADGFAGLRTLTAEKSHQQRRAAYHRGERRRTTRTAMGRWSLRVPFCPQSPETLDAATLSNDQSDRSKLPRPTNIAEDWAWQLLRRWGIVFRDLLVREDGAPSWFEVLQVLRRLEARGEIRGGRFIVGVGGEQFALPDAIQQLRRLRDEGPAQEVLIVSGADPLNLVGIITRQDRVPSTASNRVAYLDGQPVASFQGGEVSWLVDPPPALETTITLRLKGLLDLESTSVPQEAAAVELA